MTPPSFPTSTGDGRPTTGERQPEAASTLVADAGVVISRSPGLATARVRTSSDLPLAALVGLLADTTGGLLALDTVAPVRIATSHLSLHLAVPAIDGEVEATARLVRHGRSAVLTQIDITEPDGGTLVAVASLTFAIIGEQRPNGSAPHHPAGGDEMASPDRPGGPTSPLLAEVLRVGDVASEDRRASLTIDMEPRLRNSFGALNGGILTGCMANTAAAATHGELGPGARAIQLTQSFLAPGRGDRLLVAAEQLATPLPDGALVEVTMTDPDHDDRIVARAHMLVTAAPSR